MDEKNASVQLLCTVSPPRNGAEAKRVLSRNVSTRGARVAPAAVGERVAPEGAPREPRYRDVSRWATREREGPNRK
jgi:hypothetical protein